MEIQEMEITIDSEGRIQVKVNGAHGPDCLAITKNLEEASCVAEKREYLPAYYEQPVTVRGHQHIGR